MKKIKTFAAIAITAACVVSPFIGIAEENKAGKTKPYPLDKCIVSDEKLDADPGMKTFVFTHEGQEIKLCCKSCQKDFNKNPAKYLKKIEAADKADKK